MTPVNCGLRIADCGSKSRSRFVVLALLALLPLASLGCRQRMADQPYYRPLEESDFFPDKRASRPIERGTIHRAQYLESDPLVTGLTADEWGRSYEFAVPAKVEAVPGKADPTQSEDERKRRAVGAPRYDQRTAGQPKVYVEEFPFAITHDDLKRGQERYTIFCAVCHGPLGNGQGKIWERGYLTPTSFHREMVKGSNEIPVSNPPGTPLGYSRGYSTWGISIPMDQVPAGYIFEVVTKGYGGMPNYSAQIPPADRWKIIAYIRVLQMSQRNPATLSPEVKKLLDAAGGKQ